MIDERLAQSVKMRTVYFLLESLPEPPEPPEYVEYTCTYCFTRETLLQGRILIRAITKIIFLGVNFYFAGCIWIPIVPISFFKIETF